MAQDITDTTKERITNALSKHKSNDTLIAKRILLNTFNKSRAKGIATTEVTRAISDGQESSVIRLVGSHNAPTLESDILEDRPIYRGRNRSKASANKSKPKTRTKKPAKKRTIKVKAKPKPIATRTRPISEFKHRTRKVTKTSKGEVYPKYTDYFTPSQLSDLFGKPSDSKIPDTRKASGQFAKKIKVVAIWETAQYGLEKICPRCKKLDGKKAKTKPPLHPHCRCRLRYRTVK